MPDKADSPLTTDELQVHEHRLIELVRLFWPTLRPHRWRTLLGCSLIAVSGGTYGLMPLFSKALFDGAIARRSMTLALGIAGAFVLAQVARMGVWYLAMRQILLIQEKLTFALRTQGFSHLQRLSLRFHGRYPSGYIYQSIFGSAINAFAGCMQTVFKQLALYITALLTSLICCLLLSVPMTAVVLLGSVGYVALGRWLSPRIYRRTRESIDAQNAIADYIVDRLRGTQTIQSLAIEDHVQDEFESRLWPAQLKSLEVAKQNFQLNLLTQGAGHFVTGAIMVVGAWAVFDFGLSLGDLVAFLAYQATFITIVATLTDVWGHIAGARAGMDQFYSLLRTPIGLQRAADTIAPLPATIRGDLEFDGVSFGYDRQRLVLHDFELTVPAGQTVALVGASGSGKTTVANLLLRFFDPDRGSIRLDGRDVRQYPLRDYRALFGVVLQDPYLFNETIRTNLLYARPDATEPQLIDALQQAQAWDFVCQLPGGLDYPVRDGGRGLSGGQRQRLAIARCLLLDSRFVILDEPTSALVVESEHLISRALEVLFQGRTVFIIAHRLSTIRRADRILVLEGGRIVQDGKYDQLIEQEGLFMKLHSLAIHGWANDSEVAAGRLALEAESRLS
ncbi:MAG: ABC transporter ATP-binding protein [Phycisphaeraceae bacterium]|nr:ABC transporter ATP-binding protein [Phycisphaeraceae bacterium]